MFTCEVKVYIPLFFTKNNLVRYSDPAHSYKPIKMRSNPLFGRLRFKEKPCDFYLYRLIILYGLLDNNKMRYILFQKYRIF